MNMADSIRHYRTKSGLRQLDLGQKLGVSAQAVSKWELGKAEPDSETIQKLCQLFGINSDMLLGIDAKISLKEMTESLYQPDPEEERIITVYRSLNEDGRVFIRAAVSSAASNPAYQKRYTVSDGLIHLRP